MEHTRVWNQSERCWKFGTFEMSTEQLLARYCQCMEKGKYGTAEKLAGRMATTKRNEKMKYAWLRADLAAFAFKPKVNYQRYKN